MRVNSERGRQVKYKGVSAEPKPSLKARLKDKSVNVDNLDSRMVGYINGLPEHILNSIVVTSGNDSDAHGKNSMHYKNRAIDLRFNTQLYEYMIDDPNRIRAGIVMINPNHGTGKHIHMSIPTEEDFKGGYREHEKDVFLNPYSADAKLYLQGSDFSDRYKSAVDLGRASYKGWVYKPSDTDSYVSKHKVAPNLDDSPTFAHSDVRPVQDLMGGGYRVAEQINYLNDQNTLLQEQLAGLVKTIQEEKSYNERELLENPDKRLLQSKKNHQDFVAELVRQLPSMLESPHPRSVESPSAHFSPDAYRVTHFRNDIVVES